ncbi:MAG: N-acetyltransferase [Planctomycetota bacterium]
MMFGHCRRTGPCELRLFGVRGEGPAVRGFVAYGPAPLTDGTTDISWLAVDPNCQGEGIGAALVEHVCDEARQSGARQVLVETSSTGRYEGARLAYDRMGFEEVSRVPNYYHDGDDRIILVRKL